MNVAALMPAGFDPALKPTWRLLRHWLSVFHGATANRRAERLVLRFMDRGWSDHRIEALLARLLAREHAPRSERQRNRGVHS